MAKPIGKHVVVTGASTGIGQACVLQLLKAGFTPIAMVRKQADLDRLSEKAEKRLFGVCADVTDGEAVSNAAAQIQDYIGQDGVLAGLVNNAGIATPGPMMFQDFSQWQQVLDVNTLGTVRCIQAFGHALGVRDVPIKGAGRIVNITSVAGKIGWPYLSAYCASKHAVEGLSESARRELAVYGIDVIVVGPGNVKTPIWEKAHSYDLSSYSDTIYGKNIEKFVDRIGKNGVRGLEASQIADVVITALKAKNPKPRYAPVANWMTQWFLLRFLPRRWVDVLIARALQLKRDE